MALKSVAGPSPLGPIPIQPHTLGNRPAHFYHPGPEDPPGTNGSRIPYANIIISGQKWVPEFFMPKGPPPRAAHRRHRPEDPRPPPRWLPKRPRRLHPRHRRRPEVRVRVYLPLPGPALDASVPTKSRPRGHFRVQICSQKPGPGQAQNRAGSQTRSGGPVGSDQANEAAPVTPCRQHS